MKLIPKQYTYTTHLSWKEKKWGYLSSTGKPSIKVACPPEWGGHPNIWSPEDLLIGALEVCIMTTFLDFLAKKNINLISYSSQASGTASMVQEIFQFTDVFIDLKIMVQSLKEKEMILDIIPKVKKKCLISQSLNAKIHLTADITIKGNQKKP